VGGFAVGDVVGFAVPATACSLVFSEGKENGFHACPKKALSFGLGEDSFTKFTIENR